MRAKNGINTIICTKNVMQWHYLFLFGAPNTHIYSMLIFWFRPKVWILILCHQKHWKLKIINALNATWNSLFLSCFISEWLGASWNLLLTKLVSTRIFLVNTGRIKIFSWTFSKLQLSSFGELVHTVASGSSF